MTDFFEEGQKIHRPSMIAIDLDGTLVDTVPDLTYCIDTTLGKLFHFPPYGEEVIRKWVGNGVDRLLHRALTGNFEGQADPERHAQAMALFSDLYLLNNSNRSRVYEGVRAGLDFLSKTAIPLVCVTNKASRFTWPLLKQMALIDYFSLVLAGDTLPVKKPDPAPLRYAVEQFQVRPENCLFIGDSINDVRAARAAGFSIICVRYGYNHGRDIQEAGPDAVIDSFLELPQIIGLQVN